MIGITIVIIIAFGVFFTPGNRSARATLDRGFRIYGHHYTREELERRGRGFGVAMYAGLQELLVGLTGNPYSEQASSDFIFNSFILDHEAKRLGITVNDNEVADAIAKLRPFQTSGAYDPSKYQAFVENVLKPRGFTETRLEDLVRDQLRLKKLVTLVGSTLEVTPSELRTAYVQNNQKMNTSILRFDLADFKAAVQPTDAEIEKVFKEREKSYTTGEKRVVSYVKLDLNEADKALKGKEQMEARQALANRANDFGQDLLKEGAQFAEVAKKYNLTVKTTPEFTAEKAPQDLATVPNAAAAAFMLTEKDPISDALPSGDGYCMLHLDKVTPNRPLTLEEARPQMIEQIKSERGGAALTSKGNESRTRIAAAMKAGKSFTDAAQEAGLKVESFPAFSLAEPVEDKPDAQAILAKSVELADGEMSDFVPAEGGGLIIHLDKRDPIDEAQFKKEEPTLITQTRSQKEFVAFIEWLQSRRKFANVESMIPQPPQQQQPQQQPAGK